MRPIYKCIYNIFWSLRLISIKRVFWLDSRSGSVWQVTWVWSLKFLRAYGCTSCCRRRCQKLGRSRSQDRKIEEAEWFQEGFSLKLDRRRILSFFRRFLSCFWFCLDSCLWWCVNKPNGGKWRIVLRVLKNHQIRRKCWILCVCDVVWVDLIVDLIFWTNQSTVDWF